MMIKYALVHNTVANSSIPPKMYYSQALALSANRQSAFPVDLNTHDMRGYEINFISSQPAKNLEKSS